MFAGTTASETMVDGINMKKGIAAVCWQSLLCIMVFVI